MLNTASQEKKKKKTCYPASTAQILILITYSKCNYTSHNADAKPEIWTMYFEQCRIATELKTKT